MISITLQFDNLDAAIAAMSRMKGAPAPETTDKAPAAAKVTAGKPAPAATPAASAPAPTPAAAPAPAAASPSEAPAFKYETLQQAVYAAVPKYGKDTVLAIAAKHGATTFKELAPTAWKAAYNDVKALGDAA